MPSPIFLSRPAAGFSVSALVRGAQLTVVGGYRALLNPDLPKHGYYRKAGQALVYSLLLEVILRLTLLVIQFFVWVVGAGPETASRVNWAFHEVLHVRQLLVFVLKDSKSMDSLFIESLRFVDKTNLAKHPDSKRLYGTLGDMKPIELPHERKTLNARQRMVRRIFMRWGRLLVLSAVSNVPRVGKLVLPVMAFFSFQNAVGGNIALLVFASGLLLPYRWVMVFLSTFWGSQGMMRDLLRPYFKRLPFSNVAKKTWYDNRQGVLFGFGAAFYLLIKVPYAGVLVYGIASASAAYLITKISDPLPAPRDFNAWSEEQVIWTATNISID